ncbi:MAG: acylase [Bacteroidota bacterium]
MNRFFVIFLFLYACTPPETSNSEVERWKTQAENVTILRDDFGVPHVYGKTDADAVFGLLFAQCEDDFARVERNFVWATGRLAEIQGETALYSDLRAMLFMTVDEAKEYYDSAPKWLQKLCQAWADGINYYLYTHPEVTPKVLTRFEPWMTMYFTEGSIGGDIERVSTRKIQAFYEKGSELALSTDDLKFPEEPKGSNGFAIAGELTESGNAMLLINPHTSFYFRGEVHVASQEGLNAYGAVTWGQFFVYQGFNEHTGWMHTSTYTDVIDEFKETILEEEGRFFYQYGDEKRPVTTKEVTLKYKENNELKEKTFTIYRTHHGPVTHMENGQWIATALMWEPVKALEQSYIRTKQKNHAAFKEMMDMRTNSSNNTVFADSEGNIAYYHGNFIPKRNTRFDYTLPVDGSDPETDWKGLHDVDESITVFNPPNGWIQNCNSTPFTAASEYSPKKEDYPNYMSRIPENFRGVHAINLLEKVEGLTLDKLVELAYDPYLPAFEKVIPGLINAYDQSDKSADLTSAIDTLRKWDLKTGVESVGMSLAHFYGMSLYQNAEIPDDLTGMDRFNYFGTGLRASERLRIFKLAIEELEKRFGTWNTEWGEINRLQRISGDIDLKFDDELPSTPVGLTTGRWGALAAFGMRTKQQTNKIYGTRGNSFVAVVSFGEKVKAKSLLAGGQSGDPESSHFDDQVQPYAEVAFKDVAFYREDVEDRAEVTYKPGKRQR